METPAVGEKSEEANSTNLRKIFVAGATGSSGKRIVDQLAARGFAVRAGVRDVERGRNTFSNHQNVQIVGNMILNFLHAAQTFDFRSLLIEYCGR